MGKLEELEEELYGKEKEAEEDLRKRMRRRIVYPGGPSSFPTSWFGRDGRPKPEGGEKLSFDRKAFKYFFAGLTLLVIIGGSAFVFFYLGTRGQEVAVMIHGRDRIESGEILTIPVSFRNMSGTTVRDAEAVIVLPAGSVIRQEGIEQPIPPRLVIPVKDLGPNEETVLEITARLFGSEGEAKEVEIRFLYRPENLQARFSTSEKKTFTISRVPLAIFWEAPEILSHGQELEFLVRYTSTARTPFDQLALRMEYPPGFTFLDADPKPAVGENIWNIGLLEPGREGTIRIRGRVAGEEGELKSFRGALGVFNQFTQEWRQYSESSTIVKIAVTPLSVQGFLEGVRERTVTPGERAAFRMRYRNNTSSILRNVSIRAFLEGAVLLFDTLTSDKGGVFDSRSGAIVWGPGATPELRDVGSGVEGELNFTIQTREKPIMRSAKDKNLVVRLRAMIEPGEVPNELAGTDLRSEDRLEFKVGTTILFSGRAVHRTSPIPNSGSLPPRVGEETSYVIVWELRNFTNDLRDAEVRVSLPPNIVWKNVTYPSSQTMQYNATSGEVLWRIGAVPAGTGVLTPALVGAFQVSVIPAEAYVNKPLSLAGETILRATDTFTGEQREMRVGAFTTELRDDPAVKHDEGQVAR